MGKFWLPIPARLWTVIAVTTRITFVDDWDGLMKVFPPVEKWEARQNFSWDQEGQLTLDFIERLTRIALVKDWPLVACGALAFRDF